MPLVAGESLEARLRAERLGIVDWVLLIYVLMVASLESTSLYFVSTYFAYILMALFLSQPRLRPWSLSPELLLLILLTVWLGVSTFLAEHANRAYEGMWYILKIYIVSFVTLLRCDRLSVFKGLVTMVVLGSAVVTVAGAIVGFDTVLQGGPGSTGISNQANSFGGMVICFAMGALILWAQSGRWARLLLLFGSVCALIACLASGSRQSAIAIAVLLVVYYLKEHVRHFRRNLRVVVPLFLTLTVVPLVAGKLFPHSPLLHRMELDVASDVRVDLIRTGWRLFQENPLIGVGPGTFAFYSDGFVYTHTTWLELLVTGGLLAFLLYYGVVTSILVRLWRLGKAFRGDQHMRKLVNASAAVIVGLVSWGMFIPLNQSKMGMFILAAVAGLAIRLDWEIACYRRAPGWGKGDR